jgi:hypothetical protein
MDVFYLFIINITNMKEEEEEEEEETTSGGLRD